MGTIIFVVIVIAIVLVAAYFSMLFQRGQTNRSITLDDGGNFSQEIVGEASYQKALKAIAGSNEVRLECTAVLTPEDSNAYDNKAVCVTINGRTVGYLARAVARAYRRKYGDSTEATCPAVIVGGGRGRPSLGVWLDIRIYGRS